MSLYKRASTLFILSHMMFIQYLVLLFVPFIVADGQQLLHAAGDQTVKRVAVIGEIHSPFLYS